MAETAVEYVKGENYLTWYSDDHKWVNRIRQLADGNSDVQIVNDTGDSIYVHCPVSWFKSPKPPIKRNMTAEQRKAAAERMKNARDSINKHKNHVDFARQLPTGQIIYLNLSC